MRQIPRVGVDQCIDHEKWRRCSYQLLGLFGGHRLAARREIVRGRLFGHHLHRAEKLLASVAGQISFARSLPSVGSTPSPISSTRWTRFAWRPF